jgi:hypothetical protein
LVLGDVRANALMPPRRRDLIAGADRAGTMSVFYLYQIEGVPLEEARKQLSLKYLHVSAAKTSILDFFWAEWAKIEATGRIDFWT